MNHLFSAYLPQDRLRALSRSETLPDRVRGSALFADISGFTKLTEKLNRELGARRGAEEVSQQLNAVFDALVVKIQKYGGSVIGFAGDAMTCWFEEKDEGGRVKDEKISSFIFYPSSFVVSCAFSLQSKMRAFPELALKVSIARGAARRMMVGDENIQLLDTLGGETLTRMAVGEHLAARGEILVDEESARGVNIREWRVDEATGWRFGVAESAPQVEANEVTPLPEIAEEKIRAWIHPLLRTSESAFAAEFRAVTSMFVRFSGINYDSESATTQLDEYVRWAQSVVARYEGFLRAPIIGDKGSYLLIVFGAPVAHEDDTRRALRAALALRQPPFDFITSTQIGIATGVVWAGLYGGETRKSYDFIGDDVNLAARLMQAAASGEILVSGRVQSKLADTFIFDTERLLKVKGKSDEIPVFAAVEERKQRGIRIQEPAYYLPMAGRQQELELINTKLELVLQGQGQVIGITAQAGLGKSRLAAEAIRAAQRKGFIGYGGACQSDGINTPYLAWKSVWQAFFELDPKASLETQIQNLEEKIAHYAPNRVSAIPLLSVVLDLNIPDNDFTQHLEPKNRQSALRALLEDCLKSAAGKGAVSASDNGKGEMTSPLLIVIEDLHWIDALSHDLLVQLAKSLAKYRVCFLLAYRPPELERLQESRLEALAQFTRIELHELGRVESEQILRSKLTQFFGESVAIPNAFAEKLLEHAQGNPFYIEELLNYLHDRGLDPRNLDALEKLELPDSLHSLILSRIDRLLEREKVTLKVASIVGRLFKADWLNGYYPELGDAAQTKDDLSKLAQLEITPLDTPEPELAYLFKHIITHEVTYESLPYATRAKLHEQLAAYLEATYPDSLLETLAFHYEQGNNTAKKIEYLRKAGEAAQKNYASAAALEYYGKLLPLLTDEKARAQLHLKLGEVLHWMGKLNEAESAYRAVLDTAKDDADLVSNAQYALGRLCYWRSDYVTALDWLGQAQAGFIQLHDDARLAQVFIVTGDVFTDKGDHTQAGDLYTQGLKLMQAVGNKLGASQALSRLGWEAKMQGNYTLAREQFEESLSLAREIGNKARIGMAVYNLGALARSEGDYATAQRLLEESLALDRELGNMGGMSSSLDSLGLMAKSQGDYAAAQRLLEESLAIDRELGNQHGIAVSLNNLGVAEAAQGNYATARALHEEGLALKRKLGNKSGVAISLGSLGEVALAQGDRATARTFFEEKLKLSEELGAIPLQAEALLGLGLAGLAEGEPQARQSILESLRLRQKLNARREQTSSLIGMAGWALQAGHPQFAAQLLGVVDSALKALNVVAEPDVEFFRKQTLAKAKEALGEAAFQSAWEEGTKWSLEEAVKKALEDA